MSRLFAMIFALVSAVSAIGVIVVAGSDAIAEPEATTPACKSSGAKIEAANLPARFDLSDCPVKDKVITDGKAGVEIPPEGEGVSAHVSTPDGAQELAVEHLDDGTVELQDVGDEFVGASGVAAEEPVLRAQGNMLACRDRAYNLTGWKVYNRLEWYYGVRTTPRYLSKRRSELQINAASGNIMRSKNDCRMRDYVSAKKLYKGRTASRAQIDSGGYCTGNQNTQSVVSFGRLPSNYLAMACTSYYSEANRYDKVKGSDILISRRKKWSTRANKCRGQRYDIQAVLTHEFGHSFGLGHVSEQSHRNLTMSSAPSNTYCNIAARTLGRGDIIGLRKLY
ncbi:hypothetical protein BH24ACT22_BH24ACT22_09940 [soil metagenome]